MVEELAQHNDPMWVPLHLTLDRADALLGLEVRPVVGEEPLPEGVENDPTAAQNDQALAELRSMMSKVSRA